MIGKYPAKLDEKNRLFVPAKLRQELGEVFFVTLGVNCGHRCRPSYFPALRCYQPDLDECHGMHPG